MHKPHVIDRIGKAVIKNTRHVGLKTAALGAVPAALVMEHLSKLPQAAAETIYNMEQMSAGTYNIINLVGQVISDKSNCIVKIEEHIPGKGFLDMGKNVMVDYPVSQPLCEGMFRDYTATTGGDLVMHMQAYPESLYQLVDKTALAKSSAAANKEIIDGSLPVLQDVFQNATSVVQAKTPALLGSSDPMTSIIALVASIGAIGFTAWALRRHSRKKAAKPVATP